jgi:thiol peroxidase
MTMAPVQVRKAAVRLKGNPVDLKGPALKVGDKAPIAEVIDESLKPVKIGGPGDRVRILSSILSVETGVCDAETRRFNEEAAKLPNVEIQTVSVDLPQGLKRWCGAAGVTGVRMFSDHRETAFGDAYGVTIASPPLVRFLARAVFVVDKAGTIRHAEYVNEIPTQPNFEAALAAAKAAS